jgi:hypothetical protein
MNHTCHLCGKQLTLHPNGNFYECLPCHHQVRKLKRFKAYVHERLDAAGISTHPDGPHSKEGCRVGDRLDIALFAVEQVRRAVVTLNEASEERYQFLKEREAEAEKWKAEGDMHGWNFHQGLAAGANWCDIFYRRAARLLQSAAIASVPAGVGQAADDRPLLHVSDEWLLARVRQLEGEVEFIRKELSRSDRLLARLEKYAPASDAAAAPAPTD